MAIAILVGLMAFAAVAVVFSDQMADPGDAADDRRGEGRRPGDQRGGSTSVPVTDPPSGSGHLLSVTVDASDPNAIVRSSPEGIDCSVAPTSGGWTHRRCAARFPHGTVVTLSAQIPPVVLELLGRAGWSGCESTTDGFAQPMPCTIVMDQDRSVCLFTGQDDCPP